MDIPRPRPVHTRHGPGKAKEWNRVRQLQGTFSMQQGVRTMSIRTCSVFSMLVDYRRWLCFCQRWRARACDIIYSRRGG